MKFEWVYAYDRVCRNINETFIRRFMVIDERGVL